MSGYTWLRRRLWIILTSVLLLLAAATPFLWAGYHAYVAQAVVERYHSDEARAHFAVCLRFWPWSRSVRLHLLAAQAARRQGDYEEASRLIHECQNALHDNSAEVVFEWAMLRAAMGDLDVTIGPLQETAQAQPSLLPVVYEALAEGYLVMSRILDALRTTDAWLALEPNNPQAWFVRGKIHRQIGAVQSLVADCQRVLELDPERTEARWWLALALLDIGRYQEAEQQLQIYGRSHPHDVEVRVRQALCLWRLEREAEAHALLDGVLAEQPQHGLALLTRGQMHLKAFRYAEAEPWLRQAARILPYDYIAQNALWECLRQQGKTEEAEAQREWAETLYERRTQLTEILTHLMQQKPDDPALHYQVGALYLQLGSPQVGEAWLLSALRLDEHYVPALEALAKHAQERGDKERAEEYRRQAQSAKKRQASPLPK
ncbi:MAG TPA: tetratricopeptide repeat protein [Terriglobales bacterium]|nr:tetratricopeptide repeat protein [Terriglobales bacterium]